MTESKNFKICQKCGKNVSKSDFQVGFRKNSRGELVPQYRSVCSECRKAIRREQYTRKKDLDLLKRCKDKLMLHDTLLDKDILNILLYLSEKGIKISISGCVDISEDLCLKLKRVFGEAQQYCLSGVNSEGEGKFILYKDENSSETVKYDLYNLLE